MAPILPLYIAIRTMTMKYATLLLGLAILLASVVTAAARPTFDPYQCGRITVTPSSEKYLYMSEEPEDIPRKAKIEARMEAEGEKFEWKILFYQQEKELSGWRFRELPGRHFRFVSRKKLFYRGKLCKLIPGNSYD